jgi:DNA repair protein REV1
LVDKSKVNRQQRLNFSKVGEFRKKISEQVVEPVESVVQPVEGPAPEPEEEEVKNTSMTQFAIPSDLDSSVLKELPSSITRNIELQRIRNSTIIESVPSQIDVSVLRELPLEIQTELKAELRRRNLTSCSPLGRNNNNNSNNNSYLQPVFTSDKSATKYVRVLKRSPKKSPRKKVSPVRGGGGGVRINERDAARAVESSEEVKQLDEVVDMKLDEDVLKELPSSLREDIIREYREYQTHQQLFKSPKRRIEFNVNKEKEELVVERDFYSLLDAASCLHSDVFVFQKRGNIKEIISLLKDWIAHTRVNGPNAKDLDMLERYLDSLRVGGKQFFAVHKKRYYRTLIIQELSRMLTVEKEEGGISEKWMRFLDRINDL